ncbi:glycosyltransferase involved in cell wall biosynthesis [Pontibacter aydingkolensis]|uniref:Glycosyltransferase family 4 protein n=1 Tax=Pontibacter aydingkolensis TaxID=1911536 RepID=A0ABS7CQ48_9BACT|nr:glycosyltransferase family 4 protein [Pontibacter aydingkolensis]MBW7465949.1 glycosyltransferase family 4 protein [Pontibacter aydingkolensis]
MRIAIVINTSWNIFNFRLSLIKALLAEGHEVVAIAPKDAYSKRLVEAGCQFVPVAMEQGTNPFTDMMLIWRLYQTYKKVKPDVVLHYTIKPNIYGAIAAHWAGIPAINNVSGLGTVFITKDYISSVALKLYKFSFKYPAKVFFQNQDDRRLFLRNKLVRAGLTEVLPGSGINLQEFVPAEKYKRNKPFAFLMVARVLYDKGVVEFVQASKLVQEKYPDVKCQLLGQVDEKSRSGIKNIKLQEWLATGVIEYLGATDDVASIIAQADCVVLPSYREGTPRTLLEAAAMAKPLIATNVPGCREVVQQSINGYLCKLRSSPDLSEKMLQMLSLSDAELEQMGNESRHIAITRFDDRIVIQKYLHAIEEVSRQVKV